jgi:hypothetical protein
MYTRMAVLQLQSFLTWAVEGYEWQTSRYSPFAQWKVPAGPTGDPDVLEKSLNTTHIVQITGYDAEATGLI